MATCYLTQGNQVVSCSSGILIAIKIGESNDQISREQKIQASKGDTSRSKKAGSVTFPTTEGVTRLYPSEGQCYTFAIEYTQRFDLVGFQLARNVPITSEAPYVGAILVTKESTAGHLAVVTTVDSDTIVVIERNYIPGWVTRRVIGRSAVFIKGYN